jgi:hypothetical protein
MGSFRRHRGQFEHESLLAPASTSAAASAPTASTPTASTASSAASTSAAASASVWKHVLCVALRE